MAALNEQIDQQTKSSYRKTRKLRKRQTAKKFRRMAKEIDKELPAHRVRGWIS